MVNQHGDKKKERTTIMLTPEYKEVLQRLVDADDRSMGYVADKLIGYALRQLGHLKDD